MTGKYYTLSDLSVGMTVTTYELSNIYDTYILLSQTHLNEDGSITGTIEFIGDKQSQEMLDIFNKCKEQYGKKPMIFGHKKMPDGVYSI